MRWNHISFIAVSSRGSALGLRCSRESRDRATGSANWRPNLDRWRCVLRQAQDEVKLSVPSVVGAKTPTILIPSPSKAAQRACSNADHALKTSRWDWRLARE